MYMQLHIHVGAIAYTCSSMEMDLLGLKKSAAAFRNAAAERRHLLTSKTQLTLFVAGLQEGRQPFRVQSRRLKANTP